ncbi:hypothetical protein B0S90_2721 [Caldicellulosiruptor bescii]|nr:hypothetical protein Athe_2379 [Caldicellulosiruptor bescii DSM 6725]PBC88739.1 hypothetical protein B0S87_1770 [Caldicellulosiruptor bescii]PBC91780.1 hypothetical protein B0S89_2223 [Caldicellulosiruptor bescii]PBD02809.1 hypothetical protein B0S85_0351 [Caldicellulosiruptor bescii]PBD07575.1 hypothetical protein B0S90_2721 [Caldicellulosiruptor bescii]
MICSRTFIRSKEFFKVVVLLVCIVFIISSIGMLSP